MAVPDDAVGVDLGEADLEVDAAKGRGRHALARSGRQHDGIVAAGAEGVDENGAESQGARAELVRREGELDGAGAGVLADLQP